MYMFKGNLDIKINITQASKDLGISRQWLSNIINCKSVCSKLCATSIANYLKGDLEEYFIEVNM